MNLAELFKIQGYLDERIENEHPAHAGEDRVAKKILALQVELGECANEWRGFKFWSSNQEPRILSPITNWGEPFKNPLLEEYVDCLHFILSIGLEEEIYSDAYTLEFESLKEENIVDQFSRVFRSVHDFEYGGCVEHYYLKLVKWFSGLGEMLGFTWEQIEQAYFEKNKINHERQNSGY
ncbi:dimeric dUTPase (all-alpha-NTP-PPase superfamily) [Psychrobacillus insolitus]|uniref:Dimeric dUTPase (All-alpha-NTP-PPase superfamily) n=1 Tax=Psychrobacillus insolitus TaxID=1461 RepID=A0A2W7MM38_9BACI|nr:dUTP diphosphatase [Psychrobacillus insolitus]PZX07925.1 dimeric dUTPase (all-alpha-NTP-PPase superfamily) [Psychrobacillus insolitus]